MPGRTWRHAGCASSRWRRAGSSRPCRAALAADGDLLLDAAERARVEAALADLRRLAEGDDTEAIHRGIQALEQACGFYVERRMNKGIHDAMAGHRVDDFR